MVGKDAACCSSVSSRCCGARYMHPTCNSVAHAQQHVLTSVNRFLRGAGRSLLPASVAGFMAAKRRKLGWRGMALMSPLSAMVTLPPLLSSSPATRSRAYTYQAHTQGLLLCRAKRSKTLLWPLSATVRMLLLLYSRPGMHCTTVCLRLCEHGIPTGLLLSFRLVLTNYILCKPTWWVLMASAFCRPN